MPKRQTLVIEQEEERGRAMARGFLAELRGSSADAFKAAEGFAAGLQEQVDLTVGGAAERVVIGDWTE